MDQKSSKFVIPYSLMAWIGVLLFWKLHTIVSICVRSRANGGIATRPAIFGGFVLDDWLLSLLCDLLLSVSSVLLLVSSVLTSSSSFVSSSPSPGDSSSSSASLCSDVPSPWDVVMISLLAWTGSGETRVLPPSGVSPPMFGLLASACFSDTALPSLFIFRCHLCLGVPVCLFPLSFELIQFLLSRWSWEIKLCLVWNVPWELILRWKLQFDRITKEIRHCVRNSAFY